MGEMLPFGSADFPLGALAQLATKSGKVKYALK